MTPPEVADRERVREITALLQSARDGDETALDRVVPLLYDRLRLLAHRQLRRLRPGDTLDTTALVHEAYVKLLGSRADSWQDRQHFLCAAAVAMRHILVDEVRRRSAERHGGRAHYVTLSEVGVGTAAAGVEVLDLDRALANLAEVDQRLCRVVELRFFAGLTVEETGAALGLSERTVKRSWRKARAFLYRELDREAAPEAESPETPG